MEVFELKAKKRENTGKKDTKKLRKQEMIPCVLYGEGENVHFYAHKNEFRDLVYTQNVYITDLDIEGKKHKAVMQEIQFHPVTDEVLHIDFLEVTEDKPFTVRVPMRRVGNAPGVVTGGGKMRVRKRYLSVKGLLKDMPDTIDIDVSEMEVGDSVLVGDMERDGLTFTDRHDNQILAIISGRAAAAAMTIEEPTEEGEGEEGEEGEAEGEGAAEEEEANE